MTSRLSGETPSCPICLNAFSMGSEIVKKINIDFSGENALQQASEVPIETRCHHVFHEGCLADWIKEYQAKTSKAPCPLCRTELTEAAARTIEPTAALPNNALRVDMGVIDPEVPSLNDLIVRLRNLAPRGTPTPIGFVQVIQPNYGSRLPLNTILCTSFFVNHCIRVSAMMTIALLAAVVVTHKQCD